MNTHVDLLSERAADWLVTVDSARPTRPVPPNVASRGWAICEQLRRRGGDLIDADQRLIESIESRLSGSSSAYATVAAATASIKFATAGWNGLMNMLDLEEENFEHVRRETRDVFFSVLDALLLAEEAGGPDAESAAQGLFNTIVGDLYAFEPMADVAADVQRQAHGAFRLSDLLCTGVARMFDAQPRERVRVTNDDDAVVRVDEPVEEFLPLSVWLQRSQDAARLTLAALAKRLAEVPAWYVKWSPQQLRLSLNAATREFRVQVIEADGGSRSALDGWQIRTGTETKDKPVTLKAGVATLTLPEKPDATRLVLQVRDPSNKEWSDVFARVGA
jgi:hypothetical protein